jgi:predicted ATPase/DNA-binding SARP family transcriptional activator
MPPRTPPADAGVSYSQQYRRCGKPQCTTCRSGPGHGPYWYAVWREGSRVRRRYLGRTLPAPVAGAVVQRAPLQVRCLGTFAVVLADGPVPARRWGRRGAGALFKALLGAPHYRLPREQVQEWLWPEADPAVAARKLHAAAHAVRALLGTAMAVMVRGEVVALCPPDGPVWLDASAFAAAADAALAREDLRACKAALTLYGGEYLPDDPYAEWALGPRERLRDRYLALCLHLAGLCADHGDVAGAEQQLRAILATDSCHETAAARLMALLAASGRRSEALRVHDDLAAALERELGVAPAPDLAALRERLLEQHRAPVAASVPAPPSMPIRTNLPAALTPLIGRSDDLEMVQSLLARTRLLTLTGAGGCGKTRLACAAAEALVPSMADGVWLVELATIDPRHGTDPAAVWRALALSLGVREDSPSTLADLLVAFLAPRSILLVLDNCEHVVAPCAAMVALLLQSCRELRVLATSREDLGVPGETVYRVPSLAVPAPDADLTALRAAPAAALFAACAAARQPGFSLTQENAAEVARICAQLDGIPLAIELAAARAGMLPIATILARLDDALQLLTGGPRTALPRQQTLRATLDWSYALLSEPERVLLRRLAVFRAGWTLEAAAAICGAAHDPETPDATVPDLLGNLVHRSIVQFDPARETLPYRLLEPVRIYAATHLDASEEADSLQRRHLAWYLGFAQRVAPLLRGPEQGMWMAHLEAEQHNLRAALRWASLDAPDQGLALAAALWRFWLARGHLGEGRAWLASFLAESRGDPALRAGALYGASALAYSQGDYHAAACSAQEALTLYRALGDRQGTAAALGGLATVARGRGDYAPARAWYEESLALQRDLGNRTGIAGTLNNLGELAYDYGDCARAVVLYEESLDLFRAQGDARHTALILHNLGRALFCQGAWERAGAFLEESAACFAALRDTWGRALTLHSMALLALSGGELERASALSTESLALFRSLEDAWGITVALDTLSGVERRRGAGTRAAQYAEESLAIRRRGPRSGAEASSLVALAWALSSQQRYGRALVLFQEALALMESHDAADAGQIACLEGMAALSCRQGQTAQGVRFFAQGATLRARLTLPLWPVDRKEYAALQSAARTILGGALYRRLWAGGREAIQARLRATHTSSDGQR